MVPLAVSMIIIGPAGAAAGLAAAPGFAPVCAPTSATPATAKQRANATLRIPHRLLGHGTATSDAIGYARAPSRALAGCARSAHFPCGDANSRAKTGQHAGLTAGIDGLAHVLAPRDQKQVHVRPPALRHHS